MNNYQKVTHTPTLTEKELNVLAELALQKEQAKAELERIKTELSEIDQQALKILQNNQVAKVNVLDSHGGSHTWEVIHRHNAGFSLRRNKLEKVMAEDYFAARIMAGYLRNRKIISFKEPTITTYVKLVSIEKTKVVG